MEAYYKEEGIEIYNADCLEVMPQLEDKSIDLILADLPYGETQNEWDKVIPFEPLWKEYERIIKDNGAIALNASLFFAKDLIQSNEKLFRYEWIWKKTLCTGHLNANKMPLRNHEFILIFYKHLPTYNPQMTIGEAKWKGTGTINAQTSNYGKMDNRQPKFNNIYYPQSVIEFSNGDRTKENNHPTQKPVELIEYFVKTYSNEGYSILDNTMGVGTTLVAAKKLGRRAIGIEISKEYCDKAVERLNPILRYAKVGQGDLF
jgi:site-specific DNA-methyltransferase (adenine-specific)